ncbi:MAG: hypothetical protein FWG47_04755 [Propionibacteriaceae bacterium]|nr:hypothetical protein [Propionibacteriaceae bacterium]
MSDPFGFGQASQAHSGDPYDAFPSSVFGDATGSGDIKFVGPPWPWLVGGAVTSAAGAVLAWLTSSLPLEIVGWFIAGPVGFMLVILFTNQDTRQRARGVYLQYGWLRPLQIAAICVCVAGVVAAAIRVAIGVGRL